MKCYNCGGTYQEKTGGLKLQDKVVGDYIVDNVTYFKCNQCGSLSYPNETTEAIDAKELELTEKLLGQFPLDNFIGAIEAAEILGISKQALHKHRRIRRGFIHSKEHDGRRLYLKKSVELFNETGDGRIPLVKKQEKQKVIYKFVRTERNQLSPADLYKDGEEGIPLDQLLVWYKTDSKQTGHNDAQNH